MASLLLAEKFLSTHFAMQTVRLSALLGFSLAALLLARLDAIWLVLVLLAGIWLLRWRSWWKSLLIVTCIPFLTLLLYLGTNFLWFGNLMPTSGTAKSLGGQYLQLNTLFLNQVFHPGDPGMGNLWLAFGLTVLIAAGYLVSMLIPARKDKNGNNFLPICLSIALLLFTLYELFITKWFLWRWYAWLLFPMSVFFLPHLMELILKPLVRYRPVARTISYAALILATSAALGMTAAALRSGLWRYTQAPAFRYENYQLAETLNDLLPGDTVIGMGDRAGSFAYFFHGHTLQMEGLVGDEKLLQAIRDNSLSEYMSGFGVDYVLSYVHPPVEYTRWVLLTPLPGFTVGSQAGLPLCRAMEALRYSTSYQVYTLWHFPTCPP